MMPLSKRRRPRSSCSTTPHRRRSGTLTIAAMTLLVTFHPLHGGGSLQWPSTMMTDAFTMPQSAVRSRHNSNSRTRLKLSQNADDAAGGTSRARNGISPIAQSNRNQPHARLTHGQEVSLLRQMQSHPPHTSLYQMARQTLLLHNLPLVQSIVTKTLRSRPHLVRHGGRAKGGNNGSSTRNDYHGVQRQSFSSSSASESQVGTALTRDDLIHEGTIGLAEAIDRYDLTYAHDAPTDHEEHVQSPKDSTGTESLSRLSSSASQTDALVIPRGARLGTYATYWIRARILRAIQSREHTIRFPEHALQASHRLVRAAKEMGLEWHYVATELADYNVIGVVQKKQIKELRGRAGITSKGLFRDALRVRSLSRYGGVTPLESWMSPSSTASALNREEEEDGLLASEAGQEHIRETLAKFLMPREVEVLSLRYGLTSSSQEKNENTEGEVRVFRDYQVEAEEDLFGPQGMLSHYSTTPNESVAAAANIATASMTSNRLSSAETSSAAVATVSSLMPRKKSPSTLLPFKEIGVRLQFSGEYCRRTCSGAMNKLTRAVEEGRLAESDLLLGW